MTAESVLDDLDFDLQLLFWGAFWVGEIVERTALLAEEGDVLTVPMWDRTQGDLDSQAIFVPTSSRWMPVPKWWALPWVTEHRLRHDGSEERDGEEGT